MLTRKVTICIISDNSRHNLPGCLDSVLNLDYPKNLIKIILIDNNSFDSSVGYVKECFSQVKVISNYKKIGTAVLGNQGFYLAQKNGSDYSVYITASTILEKNWLKRMIEILESNKKYAVSSSKILLNDKKIMALGGEIGLAGISHFHKKQINNVFETDFASKIAMAVKMPAVKKIGFYNNKFSNYYEDVDFCWRLKMAGYKIVIDPIAVAYYGGDLKENVFHQEKNRLMMILQNYRIISLIILLPILLYFEVGMLIKSIIHKHFKQKIKSYFWILKKLPMIIYQRMDLQFKVRKVGDLEVLNFK